MDQDDDLSLVSSDDESARDGPIDVRTVGDKSFSAQLYDPCPGPDTVDPDRVALPASPGLAVRETVSDVRAAAAFATAREVFTRHHAPPQPPEALDPALAPRVVFR